MERKLRLLAVDDSRIIRIKIRKEFEPEGFEVFEAENGQDAIDKLGEVMPDVVTMDVDMPIMNGYEATSSIRNGKGAFVENNPELKSVPIVFLTANDSEEERNKGFESGATEFVTKPFFPGELVAYVKLVLKPVKNFENKTALVVDDSTTVRMILKSALQSKGVKVVEATNGAKALTILKENSNSIDIVITNYLMSEMDGESFCHAIRNDLGRKSLPIVLMTGFCEKKLLIKMFHAGANDYLIKPFVSEELFARVAAHLHVSSLQSDVRSMVNDLKRLHKSR